MTAAGGASPTEKERFADPASGPMQRNASPHTAADFARGLMSGLPGMVAYLIAPVGRRVLDAHQFAYVCRRRSGRTRAPT
jgi:hypothetical protein